jgi:hypothetical protein
LLTTAFRRLCSKRPKDASFLAGERELADEERGRAAKHRRSAEGESDSARPGAELGALAAGVYGVSVEQYEVRLEGEAS